MTGYSQSSPSGLNMGRVWCAKKVILWSLLMVLDNEQTAIDLLLLQNKVSSPDSEQQSNS